MQLGVVDIWIDWFWWGSACQDISQCADTSARENTKSSPNIQLSLCINAMPPKHFNTAQEREGKLFLAIAALQKGQIPNAY